MPETSGDSALWDQWKVWWDGSRDADRERSQWEAIVDDRPDGQRFYKFKSSTGLYLITYPWHTTYQVACSETANFKDATSWNVIPVSGKANTFYLQPLTEERHWGTGKGGECYLCGNDSPGDIPKKDFWPGALARRAEVSMSRSTGGLNFDSGRNDPISRVHVTSPPHLFVRF
ncbi:hypothetical protein FB451DRAFT_1375602 [Mycena latifolia]|nr:hypothetical protein FB451DRAFT_1375602 [Mycena latifolia]